MGEGNEGEEGVTKRGVTRGGRGGGDEWWEGGDEEGGGVPHTRLCENVGHHKRKMQT